MDNIIAFMIKTNYIYYLVFLMLGIAIYFLFDLSLLNIKDIMLTSLDQIMQRVLFYDPKKVSIKSIVMKKKIKNRSFMLILKKHQTLAKYIFYGFITLFVVSTFINKSLLVIPIVYASIQIIEVLMIIYEKRKHSELIQALSSDLSLLTASYNVEKNFVEVIRKNYDKLNPITKPAFKAFLIEAIKTTYSLNQALDSLADSLDNPIFKEWVNKVKDCQRNSLLKKNLFFIVSKLSKVVRQEDKQETPNSELRMVNNVLFLACLSIIFLINVMQKEAVLMLFNTFAGNIILSVYIIALANNYKQLSKIDADVSYEDVLKGGA